MSYLSIQPDFVATAAGELAEIGSAIGSANSAAAGPTAGLLAAAGDEVSAAAATMFSAYAQEYQAVVKRAAVFHEQFVATLAAAGNAYQQTEQAAVNAVESLLAGTGTRAAAAAAPIAAIMSDPATTFTFIVGASGYPIPAADYIDDLAALYIFPWQTIGNNLAGLNTPEGLYPLTGIKDLTLNDSVARGLTILDNKIRPLLSSGFTVNVLGYSQSSVISSLQMQLLNPTNTPGGSIVPGDLSFTLLGNPANPNGGLLSRFPRLDLPSLGITFGTATPDNSFPSRIYTIEYDGFGDFPQYPINLLADVNAFMGILSLHGTYPLVSAGDVTNAIQLTNTTHPTLTEYFIIPTAHLPLLDPVRAIPILGHPLADLVEPDLRVLVNLGYGSPNQGWSPDPPNVPTGFGVIPPINPGEVLAALGSGTQQGISAFSADLARISPSDFMSLVPSVAINPEPVLTTVTSALSSPQNFVEALLAANLKLSYATSQIAATGYATLLPTADVVNALVTAIPAYNVDLFGHGLLQALNGDPVGGLINAIGGPVAADVGLATLLAGFELRVLQHATDSIISDITGLY